MMSAKPTLPNVAQCSSNVQPLEARTNPSRSSLSLTEADYTGLRERHRPRSSYLVTPLETHTSPAIRNSSAYFAFGQWLCLKGYGDLEEKVLGRGSYAYVLRGLQYGKGGMKDEPRAFKVFDCRALKKNSDPLLRGKEGDWMAHVLNENRVLLMNDAVKACPTIITAHDCLEGRQDPARWKAVASGPSTPAVSGEELPGPTTPAFAKKGDLDAHAAELIEMEEETDLERIENSIVLVLDYCSEGAAQTILSSQEGTWSPRYLEAATGHNSLYQIMHDVTMAVKCLHTENIIHRDIKPDNILGNGTVYMLTDFGTAAIRPKGGWVQGQQGTRAFLSPELHESSTGLVQGKPVDIWALGVTFYCLLMGHLPFFGRNMGTATFQEQAEELSRSILHDPVDFETPTVEVAVRRNHTEEGLGARKDSVNLESVTPKKTSAPFTVPSPALQQLLKGMLTKDPTKRLTIEQVESGIKALMGEPRVCG